MKQIGIVRSAVDGFIHILHSLKNLFVLSVSENHYQTQQMQTNNLCVSRDTALLLKSKGFPQGETYFVWAGENLVARESMEYVGKHRIEGEICDAPTVSEIIINVPISERSKISHGQLGDPDTWASLFLENA